MQQNKPRQWAKILYKMHDDDRTHCMQGYLTEKDDFIKITGDYTELEINKKFILSIHKKERPNQ